MKIFKYSIITLCALALVSCASSGRQNTAKGTGIGAAVGAGVGAIVGHQSGNRDKGALLGAALGGLLGAGVGDYLDKQARELAEIAETKRTEKGIITSLKGDILFDSGKYYLKPAAQTNIVKIGKILSKYPEDRIRVIGHTDAQGSNEMNARLSTQRAQTVYNQLVQSGVPSQYIQIEGMGEMRPIASNATTEGRSRNRRVELEITVDEEALKKK